MRQPGSYFGACGELANKIAENERASHHAICPVAISAIIRQ